MNYELSNNEYPYLKQSNHHLYIRDSISILYFYLSRMDNVSLYKISIFYNNLVYFVINKTREDYGLYVYYLCCLYKMIGQTRDIYAGKGEKDLSYMMISVWFNYHPSLAMYAFRCFVDDMENVSFGSWCDFKYFCHFINYYTNYNKQSRDRVIDYAISILLYQFDKDRFFWEKDFGIYLDNLIDSDIEKSQLSKPNARVICSLVCKWIPRENKKYGWLYEKIVTQWYLIHSPHLFENIKNNEEYDNLLKRLKMEFRKLVSQMNKNLETTEVIMTKKKYNLYPEKVPITALFKYRDSFTRYNFNNTNVIDDVGCAILFKEHFYNNKNPVENKKLKKTKFSVGYYVKLAFRLIKKIKTDSILSHIEFLNSTWKKNVLSNFKIKNNNLLPIVDISYEISEDDRCNTIGMGILISQISKLNRCILTSNEFNIINIEPSKDLYDIVNDILPYLKGSINFDLQKTIDFLDRGSKDVNEGMYYVVLSNSKNILNNNSFKYTYNKYIQFVLWNMSTVFKQDDKIEETELCDDFIYLSGSSTSLIFYLNQFSIKRTNTFEYLGEILNTSRYDNLGNYFLDNYLPDSMEY